MELDAFNPEDPEFLGSNRHRIIEASAGTGKTHFLEQQILYWLLCGTEPFEGMERLVPEIHEILVLTFTEKATGELKTRIRSRLEQFIDQGASSLTVALTGASEEEMKRRAQRAINRFDSACIFTIHGFCNHVIRTTGIGGDVDFSIEQREEYRKEALAEVIRNQLTEMLGLESELGLAIAGFFELKAERGGEYSGPFERKILRLLDYISDEGISLDGEDLDSEALAHSMADDEPAAESDQDSVVGANYELFARDTGFASSQKQPLVSPSAARDPAPTYIEKDLRQQILQFRILLEEARKELMALARFPTDFESLKVDSDFEGELLALRKSYKKANRSVSDAWKTKLYLLAKSLEESEIAYFWNALQGAAEATLQQLPDWNDPAWDSMESVHRQALFYVLEAHARLKRSAAIIEDSIIEYCSLLVDTLMARWKRANRSLEFQDLLRFVEREIRVAPEMAAALRTRFPLAVIDEFQDTDPLQWNIFQHIYLVENPKASITVVGDPKQSIYGFRGADVSAYGLARQAIASNGLEGRLSTSYRSDESLLRVFNQIFAEDCWFGSQLYRTVEAAPAELRRWTWPSGPTGPVLEVHDLKDARNQKLRLFETARIMATDIENTVSQMQISERGKMRPVRYADIAILVSRNKDSRLIQKVLVERGIPCSIYKESGLYTSVPAYEFLVLLKSLQDPARHYRQLRLTSYFPAPLHRVAELQEPGSDHPVIRILDELREFSMPGRWPDFFRLLMLKSQVLEKREVDHLYEDRISITLQLLEEFSDYAIQTRASLEELIQYLHRSNLLQSDGRDLMRQKREDAGVSIMTVHASKGLQFPVVLAALKYTTGFAVPDVLRYQTRKGMVLSLRKDETRIQRHKEENLDEDRRLAYVCFTRAALKLFVYFVSESRHAHHPLQKDVLAPAFASLQSKPFESLVRFRNAPSQGGIKRSDDQPQQKQEESTHRPVAALWDGPAMRTNFDVRELHSFSSLARQGETAAQRPLEDKLSEILRTEKHEAIAGPSGVAFGLLVHAVLETLDFQNPGDLTEIIRAAAPQFLDSPLEGDQLNAIASMIRSTLQARLPGCQCSLDSVATADRLAELEFFSAESNFLESLGMHLPTDLYLRGFVDLVFRVDERYYILDWKTNFIRAGYSRESLAREMAHHRYDLQAKIYFHALRKWLSARLPNFKAEKNLGGAHYIFLRGMPEGEGVYYMSPEELAL